MQPEEDGAYFIDRSHKYFEVILEYLRTGKLSISHLNREQKDNLQHELDYYQIIIEVSPSLLIPLSNAFSFFNVTPRLIPY